MSEVIGKILHQAREARSISLEQAARATFIHLRYLKALEEGSFETLPSAVQARGLLRNYAEYLGLDAQVLLQELNPKSSPELVAVKAPEATEEPEAHTTQETEEIFREIGRMLQERRLALGLSLEDIEEHTHLRMNFLVLIENGELVRLPSPVQGRGMLKNFSEFMGLPPDPILLRYAEALQIKFSAKQSALPTRRPVRNRTRSRPINLLGRVFSGELVLTSLIVVFIGAFMVWGTLQILEIRNAQEPIPTAQSIADVLLATPSPSITPSLEPPSPTPPAAVMTAASGLPTPEFIPAVTLPGDDSNLVRVYVTIRQRTWVRILVDGKVQLEGRMLPGSSYQFAGENQVEILTGNAAAVQIFYNQQDLGPMGNANQIVNRIYTREGIVIPTATNTVTPTITETPTSTPRPTATQSGA